MSVESLDSAIFVELAPRIAPPAPKRSFMDNLESFLGPVSKLFGMSKPLSRDDVPNPKQEPGRSIAFLCFYVSGSYTGFATGFFIKPDALVTAAHNILMAKPSAIGVFPGYDAKRNPVLSVSARSWAWDTQRDVAVMITQPSSATGLTLGATAAATVALAGYSTGYFGELTASSGKTQVQGGQLRYQLAAGKGDSGGPVFATSIESRRVAAVHNDTFDDGSPFEAGGVFVDQKLLERIEQLEAQARASMTSGIVG